MQKIGHGGMATVHRAFLHGEGGFKREVVVKRILPELASDKSFLKMFIEEAKLSALLEHPNIVHVYDFGTMDDSYYLAMEYVEGVTLHALRKHYHRQSPFPPEAAAFIVYKVCLGLEYTHNLSREGRPLGLVHRDISPSNIMVSAHGEVKLLDFGIAKAVEAIEDEVTRTGTLRGKWSYMSPEQVLGKQATARSDIFSLGVVLWELLTGRRLFKDKSDFLTLSNVAQAKVTPVTSVRSDLPKIFDKICNRALAKKAENRYTSAEEMAEHLENVLSTSPFSASKLAAMVKPVFFARAAQDQQGSHPAGDALLEPSPQTGSQTHPSLSESLSGRPVVVLSSRRLWVIGSLIGGFLLAMLGAFTAFWATRSDDIVLLKSNSTTTTERSHSEQILIKIRTTPAGAAVRILGETLVRGVTPLDLSIPRSNSPILLVVTKSGYPDHHQSITPDRDQTASITLSHARSTEESR